MTETQARVDRHIGEVAARIDAVQLGAAMGDRLIAAIPEFAGLVDADFRAGIVSSCEGNVATITEMLVSGAPMHEVTPPPDAAAWADELVHRGMPLAALLRAYRLGHEMYERTFEEAASTVDLEPDVRWRVLADAARRLFAYIDVVCTQLVDHYESAREQWLRGTAAAQAELVQAVVAGEPVDPREAVATLHHDVAGPQLGLIVWGDARTRASDRATAPATIARRLAAELGGTQTLVVPVGEHVAWAWTTGEHPTATPSRSALVDGAHGAAIGGVHPGLDGMHRTHHEARAARRVGDLLGARPGAILRYPAVALTALATADPTQAARFVEAELGDELGADTDAMRRLRATIQVYLEESLSPSRTAKRLSIHYNTVAYRIKRAEELLGRPVDDRRLELEVALRLYGGMDRLRDAPAPRG